MLTRNDCNELTYAYVDLCYNNSYKGRTDNTPLDRTVKDGCVI